MKTLNFGSLNIDLVYSVDHVVRPGETTASSKLEYFCGGKGLNQSIALARAGEKVYHAGCVGADGDRLLKKLSEMNIPATIATAGDRYLLEHALKRIGISDYFKGIFTCCILIMLLSSFFVLSDTGCSRISCHITAGPCPLQIISAAHPVYINDFSGKVKPRYELRL